MKPLDPVFAAESKSAFLDGSVPTLGDIRRIASSDTALPVTKRRDVISAINRFAELHGLPAETLPARSTTIQKFFEHASAVKLGVTDKTLANMRSLVRFAVDRYGRKTAPLTKRFPLDERWKSLIDRIDVSFQRQALFRLATYCSVMKIAPTEVTNETLLGLDKALEAEEIVKSPRGILKNTIGNWNRSQRSVPGWPRQRLSSPFASEPFTFPMTTFPKSFQEDVVKWKSRMVAGDPFDLDAPSRPLRPETISHRVLQFRQFASALIRSGNTPITAITSLAVLTEPLRYEAALRFLYARKKNKTQHLHNLANAIRFVAKHYCKIAAEAQSQLNDVCRRLDPKTRRQMTERNRTRLAQFDDPRNVTLFLEAPQEEAKAALRERNPARRAKRMEGAVALALLTRTGLRSKTLRSLELNDFRWLPRGRCYLYVPPEKTKTGRPIELELDLEVASLIHKFLGEFRYRLRGSEGQYLFAGQRGGARSKNAMYELITNAMRRRGLVMNPHLFRHVLAKIVVETDPGSCLAVSLVLGHTALATTTGSYLGTETRAAGKQIDKVLAGRRGKA